MICTRYFNFVHVPKTGGVWVRSTFRGDARALTLALPHSVLEEPWTCGSRGVRIPPDWDFYEARDARGIRHVGVVHTPARYRGKPTLAFMRNPWDWYVSYFSYFRHRWPEGDSVEVFREVLPEILRTHSCTYACRPLVVDRLGRVACTVRRCEDGVPQQLRSFMEEHCPLIPDPILEEIEKAERRNYSKHGCYQDYYTDALAQNVKSVDAWIVQTFGYAFDAPSDSATST